MGVRVIKVNESVWAQNDKVADEVRAYLEGLGVTMFNVMSSPGSGKTTLLSAIINVMKHSYRIGEMDVDIKTTLDAKKVSDATGIDTLQIDNSGLCHIDAQMTFDAIKSYDVSGYDIVFLENIGNLVCPAEFDTGAHKNIMLLSVPEGDDKPLKYPLMFSVADLIIITKIDTMSYFDFSMEKVIENIRPLNSKANIIKVSAKTGEGLLDVIEWIKSNLVNF